MDNITFDEVELNELLVLVQDKVGELRGRAFTDDHHHQMVIESYAELEWKILKMLEG
jgi:hypothetical protein